jgi:NAD(P)-dependent dehydrogenase (short-subunit alcohol dehydrogenase family)
MSVVADPAGVSPIVNDAGVLHVGDPGAFSREASQETPDGSLRAPLDLINATTSLTNVLADRGIRVNAVSPREAGR